MSVRRLAEPHLQPKEFSFTAENRAWAEKQLTKYPQGRQASAVIPLLWRAQEHRYGAVVLSRHLYQTSAGGATLCPLERACQLRFGGATPLLAGLPAVSHEPPLMGCRPGLVGGVEQRVEPLAFD